MGCSDILFPQVVQKIFFNSPYGGKHRAKKVPPCKLTKVQCLHLFLFLVQAGIYHSTYPREGLGALLKTGRKSDLTFVVEGRELRAHRIIVACQCDYFDRSAIRSSGCNKMGFTCHLFL